MTAPDAPLVTDIPLKIRQRGGRKIVIKPDGTRAVAQREATIDNSMVKLLARGFRWHRMLHSGAYATIEELAAAEKITASYVSRTLRVAYLSPKVVEAILNGRHPPGLTMKDFIEPFPMEWGAQETIFLASQGF